MFEKIVFTLEFDDDLANGRANEKLQEGWQLLHVGQKWDGETDTNQAYYSTVYIVGATKEQYQKYLTEAESEFDKFINSKPR